MDHPHRQDDDNDAHGMRIIESNHTHGLVSSNKY